MEPVLRVVRMAFVLFTFLWYRESIQERVRIINTLFLCRLQVVSSDAGR